MNEDILTIISESYRYVEHSMHGKLKLFDSNITIVREIAFIWIIAMKEFQA